jgi:hypothetical protein
MEELQQEILAAVISVSEEAIATVVRNFRHWLQMVHILKLFLSDHRSPKTTATRDTKYIDVCYIVRYFMQLKLGHLFRKTLYILCYETYNRNMKPAKFSDINEQNIKNTLTHQLEIFIGDNYILSSFIESKDRKTTYNSRGTLMPAAKAITSRMLGDTAAKSYNLISLSNTTVKTWLILFKNRQ